MFLKLIQRKAELKAMEKRINEQAVFFNEWNYALLLTKIHYFHRVLQANKKKGDLCLPTFKLNNQTKLMKKMFLFYCF
jgi:hypothetical protein